MTRHTEERHITRTFTTGIECDFCGAMADGTGDWGMAQTSQGETAFYDEDVSRLELRRGEMFPDGPWGDEWELDICPRCFVDKIVPMAAESKRAPREFML